jgi:hypothetical protein
LLPLACLILVNTPGSYREVAVPAGRHFSSGKMRLIREHSRIELRIRTGEFVRYISDAADARQNSEAAQRRLHSVRGHFAHNSVAREAACVHTWIQDDDRHFHCADCGGRRWWRHEHERGDESLGRVARDYDVTFVGSGRDRD